MVEVEVEVEVEVSSLWGSLNRNRQGLEYICTGVFLKFGCRSHPRLVKI